jgi:photosystem II stability/assembly factor-like uncharacterized protein
VYKVLFTFFLIFLFSSSLFSQWTSLNPRPSGSTTYMGAAPSADKYIVGSNFLSEVIMTTDGGLTWSINPLPTSSQIRATFFLNENIGWIGGAGSALFKTTDGGLSWLHVPAIDTVRYDISFANENTGWGVGFAGFIMKTSDGGSNWISQSVTSITGTSTMYGVYALDADNVVVTGNSNYIFRSTNGGETWTQPASPFASTSFREVKFTSATTGFVVGNYSRIAKTTDGGFTWSAVNSTTTSTQLWSLTFNNTGTIGLASGASSALLRTTNGGDSWTPVTGFPASLTFYSVRFGSDNVAYLSGSNGYYFKSTDAGATWTDISYHFTTKALNDVSFADNLTGYIVATGFIAKTTDGGMSWTEQTSPFAGDINEVVSPSPNFAVAGCDAGWILRTTDGGANWSQIATGITGTNSDILAIDFINDSLGMAVGYNGTTALTADGGATWKPGGTITGGNPWDMDMVDDSYAWVAATGERIFRTTDGGMTWEQQLAMGGLGTYGISFANRNIGVAGGTGGNTYYTTNGGDTWTPAVTKPGNTVWGIHMMESPVYGTVALTACASGYVFKSTDGGANWTSEPRMTINTFDDVYMTDAAHAWFVGSSGAVIGYYEPANIPVELKSFTAFASENSVTLIWSTATEVNNSGFEVEKYNISESEKAGSDVWTRIAFIEGKGTSSELSAYSYTDKNLAAGTYSYRLKQIDFDGTYKYYNLTETVEIGTPGSFELLQNYPNPFNPVTRIKYNIPSDAYVTLNVYNSLGEEVASLVNTEQTAGFYETSFNAVNLSSGVYYYKLTAGSFSVTRKMILIK